MNETEAVLFAAAAAAVFAFWGVLSQRGIAARQETIELLRAGERDEDITKARRKFQELSRDTNGLAQWATADKAQDENTIAIRNVLNEYELIAIGIERGVLDDIVYRRWHRSAVVKNWRHASPYVMALRNRTDNDALYHEFEEMARRYAGKGGLPRRTIFWAKFF